MSHRTRAAILISGRGSNMVALIEAARSPDFPAEFVLVIADREAEGLAKAAAMGVATKLIPWNRRSGEPLILQSLAEAKVELICLAGFMRLLSAEFVSQWQHRILNIHPSLLPAFKGLDAIGQALNAGVRTTGVTVHHVIPAMDEGPIIAQSEVPIRPDDTAETLAARIHQAEHALYPAAVRKILGEQKAR